MKKIIGFTSILFTLMLVVSCANGNNDPTDNNNSNPEYQSEHCTIINGFEVPITVFENSIDEEHTKFAIKYYRSKNGAKETVQLRDLDLEITVNGEKVTDLPKTVDFTLNKWGGSFTNPYDYTENNDLNDLKEYDYTFSIQRRLQKNDIVKFHLKSAKAYGEGYLTADLSNMCIILYDASPEANYFKMIGTPGYVNCINYVIPDFTVNIKCYECIAEDNDIYMENYYKKFSEVYKFEEMNAKTKELENERHNISFEDFDYTEKIVQIDKKIEQIVIDHYKSLSKDELKEFAISFETDKELKQIFNKNMNLIEICNYLFDNFNVVYPKPEDTEELEMQKKEWINDCVKEYLQYINKMEHYISLIPISSPDSNMTIIVLEW